MQMTPLFAFHLVVIPALGYSHFECTTTSFLGSLVFTPLNSTLRSSTTEFSLTDRGKLTQPFTYHYAQILVISKSKLEYVYVVFLFFSSCCYCHYYCYYYIVHLYSLSNNKIVCNALDAFLTDQECF